METSGSPGDILRIAHGIPPLTPRERECLQHLSRGLRTDAIGRALNIAPVTVELHLRGARLKLAARTMPEAVARALLYEQIHPA